MKKDDRFSETFDDAGKLIAHPIHISCVLEFVNCTVKYVSLLCSDVSPHEPEAHATNSIGHHRFKTNELADGNQLRIHLRQIQVMSDVQLSLPPWSSKY